MLIAAVAGSGFLYMTHLKNKAEELEAQRRALNFLQTVAANLDNGKLDDRAFRDFMRNSMEGMPGVEYTKPEVRKKFGIQPAESTGYVD